MGRVCWLVTGIYFLNTPGKFLAFSNVLTRAATFPLFSSYRGYTAAATIKAF